MERVNASGTLYLTHTTVNGQAALRFAIGSPQTQRRHVAAAWEALSAPAQTPG
jgi:aromatic-L-amino-acid decarboxylase